MIKRTINSYFFLLCVASVSLLTGMEESTSQPSQYTFLFSDGQQQHAINFTDRELRFLPTLRELKQDFLAVPGGIPAEGMPIDYVTVIPKRLFYFIKQAAALTAEIIGNDEILKLKNSQIDRLINAQYENLLKAYTFSAQEKELLKKLLHYFDFSFLEDALTVREFLADSARYRTKSPDEIVELIAALPVSSLLKKYVQSKIITVPIRAGDSKIVILKAPLIFNSLPARELFLADDKGQLPRIEQFDSAALTVLQKVLKRYQAALDTSKEASYAESVARGFLKEKNIPFDLLFSVFKAADYFALDDVLKILGWNIGAQLNLTMLFKAFELNPDGVLTYLAYIQPYSSQALLGMFTQLLRPLPIFLPFCSRPIKIGTTEKEGTVPLQFTPNGRHLFFGKDIYSVEKLAEKKIEQVGSLPPSSGRYLQLAIAPQSTMAATVNSDAHGWQIAIWDLKKLSHIVLVATLNFKSLKAPEIQFNYAGNQLLLQDSDRAYVWDLTDKTGLSSPIAKSSVIPLGALFQWAFLSPFEDVVALRYGDFLYTGKLHSTQRVFKTIKKALETQDKTVLSTDGKYAVSYNDAALTIWNSNKLFSQKRGSVIIEPIAEVELQNITNSPEDLSGSIRNLAFSVDSLSLLITANPPETLSDTLESESLVVVGDMERLKLLNPKEPNWPLYLLPGFVIKTLFDPTNHYLITLEYDQNDLAHAYAYYFDPENIALGDFLFLGLVYQRYKEGRPLDFSARKAIQSPLGKFFISRSQEVRNAALPYMANYQMTANFLSAIAIKKS